MPSATSCRDTPWVWLIDHTMQIGALKLFVVVGCPLDRVPFGQRSLALRDLQLIALAPMDGSSQEKVDAVLEEAVSPEDRIESAYRYLLGDLMPFGSNARICLEHGGTDESKEHYETLSRML